jgi:hypothetical protein
MDVYEMLVTALEELHGAKRAKVMITKDLVDNMHETPGLVVQEQEIKKMGREFISLEHDRQLVQFIFTFWCGWLKTLRGMEWRGLLAAPGGIAKIKERLETVKRQQEAQDEIEVAQSDDSSDEETIDTAFLLNDHRSVSPDSHPHEHSTKVKGKTKKDTHKEDRGAEPSNTRVVLQVLDHRIHGSHL